MSGLAMPPRGRLGADHLPALRLAAGAVREGWSPDEHDAAEAWIEKAIRLVELNRSGLKAVFTARLGREAPEAADLALRLLTDAVGLTGGAGRRPPDLRALNAALYLSESPARGPAASEAGASLARALAALPGRLAERADGEVWRTPLAPAPELPPMAPADPGQAAGKSFLVLCPNPYSLNTLATLWMLRERGATVRALAVRRLVSLSRLRQELAFSPAHLFARVMNELVLRNRKSRVSNDAASLNGLVERLGATGQNAVDLAREMGAQILRAADFNAPRTARAFRDTGADIAVFTGGGVLRPDVLAAFPGGIVHCHPGVLPQYRGMDVVQWAVLEGAFDHVGATCQVMGADIDGGPMLGRIHADPRRHDSMRGLRTEVVERKVALLADGCMAHAGGMKPAGQGGGGGLYFLMHRHLQRAASDYMAGFR